jgi:hypothetical protein
MVEKAVLHQLLASSLVVIAALPTHQVGIVMDHPAPLPTLQLNHLMEELHVRILLSQSMLADIVRQTQWKLVNVMDRAEPHPMASLLPSMADMLVLFLRSK